MKGSIEGEVWRGGRVKGFRCGGKKVYGEGGGGRDGRVREKGWRREEWSGRV